MHYKNLDLVYAPTWQPARVAPSGQRCRPPLRHRARTERRTEVLTHQAFALRLYRQRSARGYLKFGGQACIVHLSYSFTILLAVA